MILRTSLVLGLMRMQWYLYRLWHLQQTTLVAGIIEVMQKATTNYLLDSTNIRSSTNADYVAGYKAAIQDLPVFGMNLGKIPIGNMMINVRTVVIDSIVETEDGS
jgi:hypothetical protein